MSSAPRSRTRARDFPPVRRGGASRRVFGTIETEHASDGSVGYRARFTHGGRRLRVVFGSERDGWTEARVRTELENIRALITAEIPIKEILARYEPDPVSTGPVAGQSFHEYASEWLKRRCSGELGEKPPAPNTRQHYLWALAHILPHFHKMPIDQIDKRDCERFRGKLFADAESTRNLIQAGGRPVYTSGQPRRPLSPRSIKSVMTIIAQLLEDAVEDGLRTDNPARAKRLRVKVPKPKRSFLEIDQLVALLDAASELEQTPTLNKRAKLTLQQAEEIRARLNGGETQRALRAEYGLSSGTISMLAHGRTYRPNGNRLGWRALCAVLGYAGTRISETLALTEQDVRLHDPNSSRLWIPDSKTETGIRHVEITPTLRQELINYRALKTKHGYPTTPTAPLFCTRTGTSWDKDNVRRNIITPVARHASNQLIERGLPPLPQITPHSLRRTYVSIMLLATNFDIAYVQSQVGHAQATMTLDVYNQLLDRSKRAHGTAFDALLNDARSTLYGATPADSARGSHLQLVATV